MAQKVQVLLLDDIDGNEAAETVSFGLDGVDYEIDLSSDNAGALREQLAHWIGHARKTSGGRVAASRSASSTRRAAASRSSGTSASAMRQWAKENGYQVSERGRISEQIREAYAAAR